MEHGVLTVGDREYAIRYFILNNELYARLDREAAWDLFNKLPLECRVVGGSAQDAHVYVRKVNGAQGTLEASIVGPVRRRR